MNRLIIIRGLPGSGKSYLAQAIAKKILFDEDRNADVDILSTDGFWIRPNGTHDFNPKLLGVAHKWTFDRFLNHVDNIVKTIILDNTNIVYRDFKNYVDHALSRDYVVEIMEPDTPWRYNVASCFERNKHGVPLETIQRMFDRFEDSEEIRRKIQCSCMKTIQ